MSSKKNKQNDLPKRLTANEGLAFIHDLDFSTEQYEGLLWHLSNKVDLFPKYDRVSAAKVKCHPPNLITGDKAEVPLQSLIHHRIKRLIQLQAEIIESDFNKNAMQDSSATFTFSWGFDKATRHSESEYNQSFSSSETLDDITSDITASADTIIIAATLNPLRLTSSLGSLYWCNNAPQSARFCAPIMLQYKQETTDETIKIYENIKKQIDNLKPITFKKDGKSITIKCSMFCTLFDENIMHILSGESADVNCSVCLAKPDEMNDLTNFGPITLYHKLNSLYFGVSPIHMWIQFFECLLNISYRYDLKIWKICGAEQKSELMKRKLVIQERFQEKYSLSLDKSKRDKLCTTGYISREAFDDPKKLAMVLDVNVDLIQNFKTILIAVNCQLPIDSDKFNELCLSTAKIYLSEYSWYKMPPIIHKVLAHGLDVIINTALPVGIFEEESITDIVHKGFERSDVIISTISLKNTINKHRSTIGLPAEVMELIISPDISDADSQDSDSEDMNYDDGEINPILLAIYKSLDDLDINFEDCNIE